MGTGPPRAAPGAVRKGPRVKRSGRWLAPAVLGILLLAPFVVPVALMGGRDTWRFLADAVSGEFARGVPGVLLGLWMAVQLAAGAAMVVLAIRLARR